MIVIVIVTIVCIYIYTHNNLYVLYYNGEIGGDS